MVKHNDAAVCTGNYHYEVIKRDLSKHHNKNIYGELPNTIMDKCQNTSMMKYEVLKRLNQAIYGDLKHHNGFIYRELLTCNN